MLLGKEQPYIFEPKKLNIVVWDQKGKQKLDSPPKQTITFTPANIVGHVQNARKSFHFFFGGGVFFLACLFFALANLTT